MREYLSDFRLFLLYFSIIWSAALNLPIKKVSVSECSGAGACMHWTWTGPCFLCPLCLHPSWQWHCTLYTVHCTLCTVLCTLFTVHCTPYTVHCTLYTVHCTLYTVHCTLYTIHCTLYTVIGMLYTVHFSLNAVYYVDSTIHRILFSIQLAELHAHTETDTTKNGWLLGMRLKTEKPGADICILIGQLTFAM